MEKTKILAEEFNGLSDYYSENRLFFAEELAQEIDGLLKKFMEIWRQWGYANDLRNSNEPNTEEWVKAWGKVKDEIPPIQKSIETKFRNIIGIG